MKVSRAIGRRTFGTNIFTKAHDNTFKYVIQPLILGAGVAFVGYHFAVVEDFQKEMYTDPYYPPWHLAPTVRDLPEWIKKGCGNDEYYCPKKGAVFSSHFATDSPPDLSKHTNIMAETLKERPELWNKLRERKTDNGISFLKCIKTGVDNPGHPHIKTVGMVAGDEDSYEVFKELFDPVISKRHNGYPADGKQPTNLDTTQLLDTKLDPTCTTPYECGKYILTTRVRTGRSVRGFVLPPSIDFTERRFLEETIVRGLLSMEGDLKGDYFPLHGSRSYAPKKAGMSKEKEEELRNNGNLFQTPDSTLLLSGGMGRHWPDARGIFHNESKNLFVWVNEEDHMRIVSMQKGDDIKEVTSRFIFACNAVEKVLREDGFEFMHNDHLGYILTCPSNLGTGLRAGAMMRIPKLSSQPYFKKLVTNMRLQARGGRGVDSDASGGVYDISNADRIGKGEVDLVNIMIRGTSQFVKWEMMLEKGGSIDAEVAQYL